MKINKIWIGGWFQRTGLHLFEVYDFLCTQKSPLALNEKKLVKLHKGLDIKSFELKVASIEYIDLRTKNDIQF